MIFTDRTIIVQKGTSSINDTIILYRGDKGVEIRFTLNEGSPFKFGSGASPNIIEKTEAAYGQLIIKRPNDLPAVFSEIAPTNGGKIVFTITAEMIDEITEVGNYTFQIRLLDESRNSRATIPEVVNGIEIREPIATEDTNEIGIATVGYALTTAGTTEDAFDSQGNYNKTTWGTGDRITAAKLNKIEVGIDGVNQKVTSGRTASNITIADTGNYFTSTNVEGALQEVGSQIKDKASKQEVDVERKRIDNLATLSEGSTTGDAELIDGRIGADGKHYSSIGNAIREQFKKLNCTTQYYYEKVQEFDQNKFSAWVGYTLVKENDGTLTFSYTNNQASTNYPMITMELDKTLVQGHDYYVAMDIKLKSCSESLLDNNNVTLSMFSIIGDGETAKKLSTDVKKQMQYSLNNTTTVKSIMQFTNNSSYSYTTTPIMVSFLANGLPVGASIEISILNLCLVDLTASKLSYEEMDALFTAHKYDNVSNSYFDITVSNAKQAEALKDFNKNDYVLKSELNVNSQIKIVCCGDSLTMGAGWEDSSPDGVMRGYPEFIQEFTGITTINTGIGGDRCQEIFARLGSEPVVINNITIPANKTPVELGYPLTTIIGKEFRSDLQYNAEKDNKINPVVLAGVEGKITQPNGIGTSYYFTRNEAGEEIVINRPQLLTTVQMKNLRNKDYIYVFYVGQNGGYDDIDDWILQLKNAISYIGCDKYLIIVCQTNYHNDTWNSNYARFKKEFRGNFLDIRTYLLNYGLEDNGLTPTDDDNTSISNGTIPPSLKKAGDSVHFNYYGYKTIGKIASQRLKELYPNYFN